jgi:uncharacterized UBP type Zn finger protein
MTTNTTDAFGGSALIPMQVLELDAVWVDCEPCASCGLGHAEGMALKVCNTCGDSYCTEHQAAHAAECWTAHLREED